MLKKRIFSVVVLGGSILLTGAALADSLRCGTNIVASGQRHGGSKYEVLKKCGEPKVRRGNIWVYEKGGSIREVRFNDSGRIQSIR